MVGYSEVEPPPSPHHANAGTARCPVAALSYSGLLQELLGFERHWS